ncbi:MAG: hypothetical protein ABJA50_09135, partial [Chloroflexota bacterium]
MSKRSISGVALLLIGVATGMAIGPLNMGASFAQGTCRASHAASTASSDVSLNCGDRCASMS